MRFQALKKRLVIRFANALYWGSLLYYGLVTFTVAAGVALVALGIAVPSVPALEDPLIGKMCVASAVLIAAALAVIAVSRTHLRLNASAQQLPAPSDPVARSFAYYLVVIVSSGLLTITLTQAYRTDCKLFWSVATIAVFHLVTAGCYFLKVHKWYRWIVFATAISVCFFLVEAASKLSR